MTTNSDSREREAHPVPEEYGEEGTPTRGEIL